MKQFLTWVVFWAVTFLTVTYLCGFIATVEPVYWSDLGKAFGALFTVIGLPVWMRALLVKVSRGHKSKYETIDKVFSLTLPTFFVIGSVTMLFYGASVPAVVGSMAIIMGMYFVAKVIGEEVFGVNL